MGDISCLNGLNRSFFQTDNISDFFFEEITSAVRRDEDFFRRVTSAISMDEIFFQTDCSSRSND